MSYILTVSLFSGSVTVQKYDSLANCETAMYNQIDKVLLKNVKVSECKVSRG